MLIGGLRARWLVSAFLYSAMPRDCAVSAAGRPSSLFVRFVTDLPQQVRG